MPVEFIPEAMHIKDVLNLLTAKRRTVAIVLDEYGGTSGMITIEDIVEELFGEIYDEFDNNLVDFVGRFESYREDAQKILDHLEVSEAIPHLNSSKHLNYREVYNLKTKDVIFNLFPHMYSYVFLSIIFEYVFVFT